MNRFWIVPGAVPTITNPAERNWTLLASTYRTALSNFDCSPQRSRLDACLNRTKRFRDDRRPAAIEVAPRPERAGAEAAFATIPNPNPDQP